MEDTKNNQSNGLLYHIQKGNNLLSDMSDYKNQKNSIVRFLNNQFQNKKLNIFIGSGCSTPTIPLMGATIKTILQNDDNANIKERIKDYIEIQNRNLLPENILKLDCFSDIEGFLSWLSKGIDFEKDEKVKCKYRKIYNSLKRQFINTIPKVGDEKYTDTQTLGFYENFYKYVFDKRKEDFPKLNIFTTNYDLFNEYALENHKIHYTTGFNVGLGQSFNINCFNHRIVDSRERYKDKWQPTLKEANVYKLHGSINWIEKSGILTHSNNPNDDIEQVLIYPTILKHHETRQSPYSELFREFSIQLQKTNSTLIMLGYGFGDDHINNIILQNLTNSDFTLVVFGDIEEEGLKKFSKINSGINFHIIGGSVENLDSNGSKELIKAHYFSEIVSHFCVDNNQEGDSNE